MEVNNENRFSFSPVFANNPSNSSIHHQNFGKLEQKQYEVLQEIGKPHIDSFNYMLRDGLEKAVKDLPPVELELQNGDRVCIQMKSVLIGRPLIAANSVQAVNLKVFPAECRSRGVSYTGKLQITFTWSLNGAIQETIERVVGDIPIMVKSRLCNLSGLNPKQLVQKGEEAEEFGGYFIANGNEKILRMLILQRGNYPLAMSRSSWKNRGRMFSEYGVMIRSVRPDQSSVNMVLHYLTNGTAQLMVAYQRELFFIPIILVLKALVDASDYEICKELIKGKEKNSFFKSSIINMLRLVQEEELYSHKSVRKHLGKSFRLKVEAPRWWTDEEVCEFFMKHCICVHLTSNRDKFNLLGFMLRKLFAVAKGECALESPDNPMNHEVLLPGHLYLIVLKERLQIWMKNISFILDRKSKMEENFILNKIQMNRCLGAAGNPGKALHYLVSTGNLMSKSGLGLMQTSGLAVVADKLNYWRYISHFRCIHRGSYFQEMRTTTARKLLPEAWGYLCPVHTPDGSPCGLLNHMSVQCQVTNEQPSIVPVLQLLATLGMSPFDSPPSTSYKESYSVLFDGRIVGWVADSIAPDLTQNLRYLKAKGMEKVPPSLEICLIPKTNKASQFPGLYLFSNPSRMMRPVRNLIANEVELIGSFEQVYLDICIIPEEAHPKVTTHMELSEINMLSILGNQIPYSDHNQSPRNMYECQMGKQTMGTPCHTYHHRSDNKMYRIQNPQSPLVRPVMHDHYRMDNYPFGTNAIVAVISYTGYDMEDAMIMNKSSLERGFKMGSIYKSEFVNLRELKGGGEGNRQITHVFGRKESENDFDGKIDLDGLPFIGSKMEFGQPMCSYIDVNTGLTKVKKYQHHEESYVTDVKLLGNDTGSDILQKICITFWIPRNPIIGDKFASRHGQKGVCSQKWPLESMPFTESGMTPDIVFNPHGFPSRMTIGMMIESMAGKSGSLHGQVYDATPFRFSEEQPASEYFGELLQTAGYNYYGTERMYSGVDGRELEADIFFGVVYYQRLRHMVADKFQVRTTGPIDTLTHQPVKGRKRAGGIRFGEMERDSLLAHGTTFLLQDRLFNCSDRSICYVCQNCGSLCSPIFEMLPMEELSRESNNRSWRCLTCQEIESVVTIALPFVFRYLVAELASMSIRSNLYIKSA